MHLRAIKTKKIYSFGLMVIFMMSLAGCSPTRKGQSIQYKCLSEKYCSNPNTSPVEIYKCEEELGITCCPAPGNTFNLVHMQQNQACCTGKKGHGQVYNKVTEICVGGIVKEREEFEDHCGSEKTFNVMSQVCCKRDEQTAMVYDFVETGECCNETYLTNINQRCCGGSSYLKSESTCCWTVEAGNIFNYSITNIPYGQCCNGQAYNANDNACSENGAIVPKAASKLKICKRGLNYDPNVAGCCGRESLYDHETQLCGGDQRVYMKTNKMDDAVCLKRNGRKIIKGTAYRRGSGYACTSGEVIRLLEDQKECGGKVINTTTDLCCPGGVAWNNVAAGSKCCAGSSIYNPSIQTCCMNEVSNKVAEHDAPECCGKRPFNPETHSCESRKIVTKECVHNNLSLKQQCALTDKKRNIIKKQLGSKGVSVYRAKAVSVVASSKASLRWKLADVRILEGKRKSLKMAKAPGNSYFMESKSPCSCLNHIEADEEYLIITLSKLKKRGLKIIKLDKPEKSHIIALKEIDSLGTFFSEILQTSP